MGQETQTPNATCVSRFSTPERMRRRGQLVAVLE